MTTKPKARTKAERKPKDGRCCSCGNEGSKETPCPKRKDKTHCVHWWEGVEQPDGSAK